jgi:uncharacterized protein YgbK (DUF1537 family)
MYYLNVNQKFKQLPSEYAGLHISAIREEFLKSEKTIVVLDDDPTGTQTCHNVTVLTVWNIPILIEELEKKPSILFILTNSRSLPEQQAIALANEIGDSLNEATRKSGREIIIISRSDSTLRGHFPAEVDAVALALNMQEAITVLIPAFIEGGRYTIDNVHYIVEGDELIPVSDTPFAKDVSFGYKHANLKDWVEEKTKGRVKAFDVNAVSIEDIRLGGPEVVSNRLIACPNDAICIMNAASYKDLEVIAMGLLLAEKSGKKMLFRTSATIVPILSGVESGKSFLPEKKDFPSSHGSLIVVGSHVPKTSGQLSHLLAHVKCKSIELNVREILKTGESLLQAENIIAQIDSAIAAGTDVVIYTSRKLEVGADSERSLEINAFVSGFLVRIVQGLLVRPKYIIAKGGITSSDLATKGLSAEKAVVLGAVIPGVPVWQMESKSKFPGLIYVVFPGNVGDEKALLEVCTKFKV